MKQGFVSLIGAGPGDAGLLTLRGRELLNQADVVVYDRLVSPEILRLIPPGAERIDVGKESRFHPVKQEEINQILLQKAESGKQVVRLKGGDPFVFGRGGEELELLADNNIPFEVVPGITSAIAAMSYAGIPATHRDYCSSIHIITGHAREGGELDIPFKALVQLKGTLVFLMGVSALDYLTGGLLEAGMSPDMPAAVIENGTRPEQRKVLATVGTLVQKAALMGLKSPAIIAVGRVCTLSGKFDWYMNKPLFGRKVLVTRPRASSGTLVKKLYQLGAEPVEFPCIEVTPIPENKRLHQVCDRLGEFAWILFTSKNGVEIFFEQIYSRGLDARALANIRAGAVGSQTGNALRQAGIIPDFIPEVFDGRQLAEGVADMVGKNEKVLVFEAEIAGDDVAEVFSGKKIFFEKIPLYRTNFTAENSSHIKAMINSGELEYVTFTSASTVDGFIAAMGDTGLQGLTSVCIGEQTARAAEKNGIRYVVASQASIDSLIDKLLEVTANDNQ